MKTFRLLSVLGCLAAGAITSQAAAVLNFNNGATIPCGNSCAFAGTMSLIGTGVGVQYVQGTNIPIVMVTGTGTPLNDGSTLAITGGLLNFTTGTLTGVSSGISSYGAGGSFTITGAITALGLNSTSTPLLTATNITATYEIRNNSQGRPNLDILLPGGPDSKDSTLVSYFFGGQLPTWIFSGEVRADPRDNVFYSNINNTATVIPEPASMLLLGTAMVGVALAMRRRRKNSDLS